MPSEQTLAAGCGFRVLKSDNQLIFERPSGGASPLFGWISLGLSFLGVLVGISLIGQSIGSPQESADLRAGAVILFALAAVAFFSGRRVLGRWRRQREELGPRLVLFDTALRNEQGEALAPKNILGVYTNIDWTDGMGGFRFARIVSLRWDKESVPIFKSYDKQEIKNLREALAAQGLKVAD